MIGTLAGVLTGAALLVALVALLLAALDRPPPVPLLGAAAGLEVLLLVQVGVAVVQMVAGQRPGSIPTFLGYSLVSLLVLPLGVLWALEEKTRWSTVVLAGAAATVAVLVLRMGQVWSGASA